jgi:hypothetical protein
VRPGVGGGTTRPGAGSGTALPGVGGITLEGFDEGDASSSSSIGVLMIFGTVGGFPRVGGLAGGLAISPVNGTDMN